MCGVQIWSLVACWTISNYILIRSRDKRDAKIDALEAEIHRLKEQA